MLVASVCSFLLGAAFAYRGMQHKVVSWLVQSSPTAVALNSAFGAHLANRVYDVHGFGELVRKPKSSQETKTPLLLVGKADCAPDEQGKRLKARLSPE